METKENEAKAHTSMEEMVKSLDTVAKLLGGDVMKEAQKLIENYSPVKSKKGHIIIEAKLVDLPKTFWDKIFKRQKVKLVIHSVNATISLNKPGTLTIDPDDHTISENLYKDITNAG